MIRVARLSPPCRLLVLALVGWVSLTLQARTGWADHDAQFKAGIIALEEGRAADALKAAEDGYIDKKQTKFLFLKALALEKLGRIEDAWQVIQVVLPRDLFGVVGLRASHRQAHMVANDRRHPLNNILKQRRYFG